MLSWSAFEPWRVKQNKSVDLLLKEEKSWKCFKNSIPVHTM